MRELLQAVVEKNFPSFEEGVSQILEQKVRKLIDAYRPVAVNKFIAESENLSRHNGGEYIFEDGSWTDVSTDDVKSLFEGIGTSLAARVAAEQSEKSKTPVAVDTIKIPDFQINEMKEVLDYFVSASKKNYDAYRANPTEILEALMEAEIVLPHKKAKVSLFESMRDPISFETTKSIIDESWKNVPASYEEYREHRQSGKSHDEARSACGMGHPGYDGVTSEYKNRFDNE